MKKFKEFLEAQAQMGQSNVVQSWTKDNNGQANIVVNGKQFGPVTNVIAVKGGNNELWSVTVPNSNPFTVTMSPEVAQQLVNVIHQGRQNTLATQNRMSPNDVQQQAQQQANPNTQGQILARTNQGRSF